MDRDEELHFQHVLKITKDPVAAAIMILAGKINGQLHDFDHQICMGIRHGLFGSGSDSKSILDLKQSE